MKALRFRSSHTSSLWKLKKSTVIGLGQQGIKEACSATFATSIESLEEDAEITDDMSFGGSPFKNNQSTQTRTAPSLNNMKNTSDTQKQHGQANDRSMKENSTKVQMETKNIGNISSESQAPNRGAGWDISRKVLPQVPGRDGQILNNPLALSPNHLNMLVANYKSKEWDAFAELDNPAVDSEHEKLSTCINRILSSDKEQQISPVSDTRMTEVQVAWDNDSSKKNIPARETLASKREILIARAKMLSNSKNTALKFVLEDHLREKEKKEVAMKQEAEKEKKEVATKQKEEIIPARETFASKRDYFIARAKSNSNNTALKFVLEDHLREEKEKKEVAMKQEAEKEKKEAAMKQKEEKEKKEAAMKQKEDKEKKEEVAMKQKVEKEKKEEVAMKQKPFNQVTESDSIHGEKSVSIEYIPDGISILDIRKAFSVYGDIVGCFLRAGTGGIPGCHIEFKTTEDKERALSDRWVIVNGKQLSVCRVDFPVTTVVRITNLDRKMPLNDVHKICMSYGNVESLQMREDDAVDACFCISESHNIPKILEKLNEVKLNNRRWIAQPAPRLSKCLPETPEGQNWAGKQLSNQMENIRNHLRLKRIYLEDLEELHDAITHIKECPNPLGNGST